MQPLGLKHTLFTSSMWPAISESISSSGSRLQTRAVQSLLQVANSLPAASKLTSSTSSLCVETKCSCWSRRRMSQMRAVRSRLPVAIKVLLKFHTQFDNSAVWPRSWWQQLCEAIGVIEQRVTMIQLVAYLLVRTSQMPAVWSKEPVSTSCPSRE